MAVIVRIWRTGVHPERLGEYRKFARDRSVPMFRGQPGCRGVLFAALGSGNHAVVTFWDDAAAVARLDRSPSYQDTAAALTASGILQGEQHVEVLDGEVGFLDLAGVTPEGEPVDSPSGNPAAH